MKNFILSVLALLVCTILQAQPNNTRSVFIKSKICSKEDKGNYARVAIGNLICALSYSQNVKGINSQRDAKLVIMNQNFDTIRNYYFGGSGNDEFEEIHILPNGHLLLAGISESKDMDLAGIGHTYAATEICLIEVDTNGHIYRCRTFGGSNGSQLFKSLISDDGYIYTCGATLADDYDFAHVAAGGLVDDAWVAKLDTAFQLIWVRIYAGDNEDDCLTLEEVNNNRFFLTLVTNSTDTVMGGVQAKGYQDLLVVYIDSGGNEIWKKRLGGTGVDVINKTTIDKANGILYGAGTTNSMGGDIGYRTGIHLVWAPYNYNSNIWVVKIDTNGNLLQSKAYGDKIKSADGVEAVGFYNNEFWVVSTSVDGGGDLESPDPPVSDTIRNTWIGILDSDLYLVGRYVLRTNCSPHIFNLFNLNTEFYAFGIIDACPAANTWSCDTIREFHFILHIGDAPLSTVEISDHGPYFDIYPNPNMGTVFVTFTDSDIEYSISVTGMFGDKIYERKAKSSIEISTQLWPSGTYIITVQHGQQKQSKQFIKT